MLTDEEKDVGERLQPSGDAAASASTEEAVPPSAGLFARRETAIAAVIVLCWLGNGLWNFVNDARSNARPTGEATPVPVRTAAPPTATKAWPPFATATRTWPPFAASSTPPQSLPAPPPMTPAQRQVVTDSYTDLYAHDVIGGLLIFDKDGPAELRLTSEQKEKFKQLWPEMRKNLSANSNNKSPLDAKFRAVLTPTQKEGIRNLGSKLTLPPRLSAYIGPFEALLGIAAAPPSPTPLAGASASPAVRPDVATARPVVEDSFLDLYLHDMIGGIIVIAGDGPEKLKLTAGQRKTLMASWPQIRKRLERNEMKPSELDETLRTILTTEQKSEIRTLLSSGKVRIPGHLSVYAVAMEAILNGTYSKPVATAPSGHPAPAGTPVHASTPGAVNATESFGDLFLHDAIGGMIIVQREGPQTLRVSTEQRNRLEALWPEIRKRLEANSWKPTAVDTQVLEILTPAQKNQIRSLRSSGKLQPPPSLKNYVEPFGKILQHAQNG